MILELLATGRVPSNGQAFTWAAIGAVTIGLLIVISAFFNRRK